MLFLLIIFVVGFILYIYSVEIYNYFIENYNECVKTLLNIFVNILQFLFMLIYSVWGLNFSFESLRLPLLFFGFEAGNEAENEAENEEAIKPVTINASKAAEDEDSLISGNSDKPTGSDNYIPTSASPPVNDAPQSMEDIIEGEPIKVSDNITNSSASDPAHISNSTSNNNDSELAPELGSAITQTPVEELSEEDRSVRDWFLGSISDWEREQKEEEDRIARAKEEAEIQKQEAEKQRQATRRTEEEAWIAKVNSSDFMAGKPPLEHSDYDFREKTTANIHIRGKLRTVEFYDDGHRELHPETW